MDIITALVGTKYAQNIGSTARAVANMGGSQLVLIAPKCEVDQQSYLSAAGAQSVLDKTQVFKSWDEYLKFYPNSLRIAFSARDGKGRMAKTWEQFAPKLISGSELDHQRSCHLVFGPEDCGLTDKDLLNCNFICKITTYGEFNSLNLSQAVLLAMYNLKKESSVDKTPDTSESEDLYTLNMELLEKWLITTGFNLSSPRVNAYTILRKYFNRSLLTYKEKQMLEKALFQCLNKMTSINVSK